MNGPLYTKMLSHLLTPSQQLTSPKVLMVSGHLFPRCLNGMEGTSSANSSNSWFETKGKLYLTKNWEVYRGSFGSYGIYLGFMGSTWDLWDETNSSPLKKKGLEDKPFLLRCVPLGAIRSFSGGGVRVWSCLPLNQNYSTKIQLTNPWSSQIWCKHIL